MGGQGSVRDLGFGAWGSGFEGWRSKCGVEGLSDQGVGLKDEEDFVPVACFAL